MKQMMMVLVTLCFVANISLAGDDATPKTRSGDKAWLFTLSGLGNLGAGSFMGGVGGKYYISDGNAIRVALGFGTATTTTKYTGAPSANFADIKQSATAFSISPGFLHNLTTSGPVVAYVGAQMSFGTSSTTTENPGFVANNKIKDTNTLFGVAGIAGVEWFAWSVVTLGAEYQLAYFSSSGTHEITTGATTTSTDAPSTSGFGIGSASSANLTVAVYW